MVDVLSRLDVWRSLDELRERDAQLSQKTLDSLLERELIQAWRAGESEPPSDLHHWNLFDLAVQRRSNTGGYFPTGTDSGGAPPAAFKLPPEGACTVLPPPSGLSMRLDAALARRRSIRTYGQRPVDLCELSNLLHHALRVAEVIDGGALGACTLRPFPQGGARSELEVYVVANIVSELTPGVYYFDARKHELVGLDAPAGYREQLSAHLDIATGLQLSGDPPVALLITAVFERIMWKYDRLGLSLVYKDVGALLQTLYLVATALGLAPCAIGALPELPIADWLGLDPLVESAVGCLLLGTRS